MTSGSVDLGSLLRAIWSRRRIIALATVLGAAVGLTLATLSPRAYRSEGLLEPVQPAPLAASPTNALTQLDVLRSRALLADVVTRLDLGGALGLAPRRPIPAFLDRLVRRVAGLLPGRRDGGSSGTVDASRQRLTAAQGALDALQAGLGIGSHDGSGVVTIDFTAGTPDLAASVVNGVMAQYVAEDLAARRQTALEGASWLVGAVAAARLDAETAMRTAKRYRADRNLLILEAGSTATLDLRDEQASLQQARQDLARALTEQSLDRAAASTAGAGASSAEDVLASPLIGALREREADVLQSLSEASPLGSRNPVTLAREDELRAIRTEIAQESRKVSAASGQSVDLAAAHVQTLERLVGAAQAQADRSGNDALGMAQLNSEADAKSIAYNALLTRLRELRVAASQLAPARILSPAVPPLTPEGSHRVLMLVFGALFGSILASSAFALHQLLSGRVHSAAELASLTGMPDIGSLPVFPRHPLRTLVELALEDDSAIVQTLRGIRLGLQRCRDDIKVVLVTSADLGEGKSTVAAALALRAAADGLRVLLIEADLYRPTLGDVLNIEPTPCLEDLLLGRSTLGGPLPIEPRSGLSCLLANGVFGNAARLLGSDTFASLIDRARARFDLVIIDSPPTLRVSDAALVAAETDVILFTVRAEHTSHASVREGLRRLSDSFGSRVVTLLNRAHVDRRASRGYWDGYGLDRPGEAKKLLLPSGPLSRDAGKLREETA